jgi:hypothetical protein
MRAHESGRLTRACPLAEKGVGLLSVPFARLPPDQDVRYTETVSRDGTTLALRHHHGHGFYACIPDWDACVFVSVVPLHRISRAVFTRCPVVGGRGAHSMV